MASWSFLKNINKHECSSNKNDIDKQCRAMKMVNRKVYICRKHTELLWSNAVIFYYNYYTKLDYDKLKIHIVTGAVTNKITQYS